MLAGERQRRSPRTWLLLEKEAQNRGRQRLGWRLLVPLTVPEIQLKRNLKGVFSTWNSRETIEWHYLEKGFLYHSSIPKPSVSSQLQKYSELPLGKITDTLPHLEGWMQNVFLIHIAGTSPGWLSFRCWCRGPGSSPLGALSSSLCGSQVHPGSEYHVSQLEGPLTGGFNRPSLEAQCFNSAPIPLSRTQSHDSAHCRGTLRNVI